MSRLYQIHENAEITQAQAQAEPQVSPLLVLDEELRERMEVMFWQEMMNYQTCDYLACGSEVATTGADPSREGVMNEQWRSRMCEWAFQCKFYYTSILLLTRAISIYHSFGSHSLNPPPPPPPPPDSFLFNQCYYYLLLLLLLLPNAVVDHFELPRSVVGTCLNYLDRYLEIYFKATATPETGPVITKREFQISTMTCLYVAIKLTCEMKVPMEYMVQLSRGTVTAEDLKAREMNLLPRLSWLLNPPTAFDFLNHYVQLLMPNTNRSSSSSSERLSTSSACSKDDHPMTSTNPRLTAIKDSAVFMVELSVLDYYFVGHRPSTVAIAALINALEDDTPSSSSSFLQQNTHNHGLDAFILPGEQPNVYLCRQRLNYLYRSTGVDAAVETDAASKQQYSDDRTASPVSVANCNHSVFGLTERK